MTNSILSTYLASCLNNIYVVLLNYIHLVLQFVNDSLVWLARYFRSSSVSSVLTERKNTVAMVTNGFCNLANQITVEQ